MVIFRYSVAKGMIYRGKVLTCIKKHHKMVEICHVTEYVCTSWPRNWINIMRQKPWDNFSTLSKIETAKNYHFQIFAIKICKILQTKWYFDTKIVLTYCEKKLFLWSRKTFKIRDWSPRICKNFEITRTVYSNSESSEQYLVTECFFNFFLEVSYI